MSGEVPPSVQALMNITGNIDDVEYHAALLEAASGDLELATALHFDSIGNDNSAAASSSTQPLRDLSSIPREILEEFLGRAFHPSPLLRNSAELKEMMIADRLSQRIARSQYCWSLNFDKDFLSDLLYEGFLPISSCVPAENLGTSEPLYVLQPKLHLQRCIIDWPKLHCSKKARKLAKRYTLTVSTAFEQVLLACVEQHGEDWLYPPTRQAYTELSGTPRPGDGPTPLAISFELWAEASADQAPAAAAAATVAAATAAATVAAATAEQATTPPPAATTGQATRRLVAGEFGAICGSNYLSLSGFRAEDNAGSVQMYLTAETLRLAGFAHWDLGQDHEYKFKMGGELVPRADFLRRFRRIRDAQNSLGELLELCGHEFTEAKLAARAAEKHVEAEAARS